MTKILQVSTKKSFVNFVLCGILFAIRENLKCPKKYLLNSSKNAKMKKFEIDFDFEVRHPVVDVSNNTIVANIQYQGKFFRVDHK